MKGWTDKFKHDDFRRLGGVRDHLCVSIYIPTHKSGIEVNESLDLLMFKDEVKKAEILLKENGMSKNELTSILSGARDLIKDKLFWKKQIHGFVAFMSEGTFEHYRLPFNVEAFTYVGKGFYLTPLIPVVTDKSEFFVLSLAKNGVSLYKGTHYDLSPIAVEGLVPSGIDETTRFDVHEKQSRFKSNGGSNVPDMYFGNQGGEEVRKDDVELFLHQVNDGIMKVIGSSSIPLVLCGVDYIVAMFRKLCTYPFIHPEALTGNKEYTSEEELHADAWALVRPIFDKTRITAEETFENLSATKKTSSEIDEIVSASVFSRVDKLFLKENCHIWGYFDEKNNQVVLHKHYMKGDEDLANKAAVETILHGGEVYVTSDFRMPVKSSDIAAVFRYGA